MAMNDYLKCPGLENTLAVVPLEFNCPQCGSEIELWSDELKRRCTQCGTMFYNPNPVPGKPESEDHTHRSGLEAQFQELLDLALSLGASGAKLLSASQVQAVDELAALCLETKCQNYGLSPTCPPNVQGPAWLRGYLREIDHALFIKLELPTQIMYSDQRREIGKLLHFMVAQVEQAAQDMGLSKSLAFAGGSCKKLFCPDEASCQVLHGDGQCRNPGSVRPSVSGLGININRLMKAAGWDRGGQGSKSSERLSLRCGLVLLG